MAQQHRGSEVIICTDGTSNVGLGSLEDLKTEKQISAAKDFYRDLGLLAKKSNTTISIIGIEVRTLLSISMKNCYQFSGRACVCGWR
jgi:hypothetical protein